MIKEYENICDETFLKKKEEVLENKDEEETLEEETLEEETVEEET